MQRYLLLRAGTRLLPNKEVVSRKLAERELPLPVHRRVWSRPSSSRSLLRGRGEGRLPRGRAPGSLRQGGGRKGLAGLGGVEAFPEFLRWLPNLGIIIIITKINNREPKRNTKKHTKKAKE